MQSLRTLALVTLLAASALAQDAELPTLRDLFTRRAAPQSAQAATPGVPSLQFAFARAAQAQAQEAARPAIPTLADALAREAQSKNDAQEARPKSPKELLARAAYVEEHEHDLDAAAKAYQAAAEAAEAAGDKAVAQEAKAALARVAVRQGKVPAAPATPNGDALKAARALLRESASLADEEMGDRTSRLALYGDLLVPYARAMLDPRFAAEHVDLLTYPLNEGGFQIESNPHLAVYLLGTLDSPSARSVLEAAYSTPDPVLRSTIVGQAGRTHYALYRMAADDEVQPIRSRALQMLANSNEPANGDVMQRNALRGNENALNWLARLQPLRALVVLDQILTSDGEGEWQNAFNFVKGWPRYICDAPTVGELLRLINEGRHLVIRRAAQSVLSGLITTSSQSGSLPPEIEATLLEGIERTFSVPALEASAGLDPVKVVHAITIGARLSSEPFSDAELRALTKALSDARSEALTVQDLRELFDALAPRERWVVDNRNIRPACDVVVGALAARLSTGADTRMFVDWFAAMPLAARERYRRSLSDILKRLMFPPNGEERWSGTAPLDRSVLPVVDFLAQLSARDQGDDRTLFWAWSAIGDPALLERVLDLKTGVANSNVATAGRALVAVDVERAKTLLWTRVSAALAKEKLEDSDSVAIDAIHWLPEAGQLPFFQRAYAAAKSKEARGRLLYLLIRYLTGPGATAEIVKLWPTFEVDASELRKQSIQRFTNELFEPAIPLLGEALKSSDASLRGAARNASDTFREQRQALEEFASWTAASKAQQDAVAELTALLANSNRDVVLGAVKALAAVKAKTALPALVKLLARDDADLKAAVQEAIDKIGG